MSAFGQRAWLLYQQDRYDQAANEWRAALAQDPDDAGAHAGLALCLVEKEDYAAATREATLATSLEPDAPFSHYVRSFVLSRRNRFDEAIPAIEEAIRLDPEDADYRGHLSKIRAGQGRWKECLAAADAGLSLDAQHEGCVNLRAMALRHLDRNDEAAQTIAGALGRSPENSMTHANQGWTLLKEGDHRQALVHFQEALRIDPNNDWARTGMLTALKAKNIIYRQILAFFLFLQGKRGWMRAAIIGGILITQIGLRNVAQQTPEAAYVIWPIIFAVAAFVYLTWLANPLMNLSLLFSRFGRMALDRDEKKQALLVGLCVAFSAGMLAFEFAAGFPHHFSVMLLLLSVALSVIHGCHPGWPRLVASVVGCLFAALLLFEFGAVIYGTATHLRSDLARSLLEICPTLNLVYYLGFLAWTFVGQWLRSVIPAR